MSATTLGLVCFLMGGLWGAGVALAVSFLDFDQDPDEHDEGFF